jgi:cobalt-precorrin 5A hydrolase
MAEMHAILESVLARYHLASASLRSIASIDIKADEDGLIGLARHLSVPLALFSRQELEQVNHIQTPSTIVEKHVGVKSVCEAAAILAARNGTLIVPKHSTKNVTVAVARISFSS